MIVFRRSRRTEPKRSRPGASIGKNLSVAYREPVKIVRGWMQYLFDENGRKYLDAYNNVPHVGHCHPRVTQAAREQMATLNTNTRYLHDRINQYAEALCATLPDPLSVCFFVNSASEANELALRLARAHTRRRDMIVLEAAYHGHTTALIDISPYKHDGPGGAGAPGWVHTAPIPDVYRGRYKRDDPQAGENTRATSPKSSNDYARPARDWPDSSPNPAPASAARFSFPMATSRRFINTCAKPAASASLMKCKPVTGGLERAFTRLNRKASRPTSSCWENPSATAIPSAR